MRGERGDRVDQADVVLGLFAQTENTACADVNPGVGNVLERRQALVVGARRDDGGIVFPARIDVMIIRREACFLELLGLSGVNHACSTYQHFPNNSCRS